MLARAYTVVIIFPFYFIAVGIFIIGLCNTLLLRKKKKNLELLVKTSDFRKIGLVISKIFQHKTGWLFQKSLGLKRYYQYLYLRRFFTRSSVHNSKKHAGNNKGNVNDNLPHNLFVIELLCIYEDFQ